MHKLIKNAFNITFTVLKGLQFLLILFALLTMVDFILSLVGVQLPTYIQNVFDTIYKLQSNFYKPDLSVLKVDFTLAIASVVMLAFAGIMVYVLNFLIEFEQIYDKVHADNSRRYEQKFNKNLSNKVDYIESQIKQFAIFYTLSITQAGRNPHFNKKINIEVKESEYRTILKNIMINSFNAACKYTKDGYLLFFDDIDYCEKVFKKFYDFISKAKSILKNDLLTINIKATAIIAGRTDNPETYLPKMKKLISIASDEKIIILSDFKEKYEKLSEHNFNITALGEYSFIDDILEVYALEPNHQ